MPKKQKKLKVLFVASEVSPYAKSGGLGDVAGSLPNELRKKGVDIRIVFPKYRNINYDRLKNLTYVDSLDVTLGWRKQGTSIYTIDSETPTYLLENFYYYDRDGLYGYGDDYERFAFFCKASIEFLSVIDFQPDIIHYNDWQTGPACIYLKDLYKKFAFYSKMKSLFTIHNLQYQGIFGRGILGGIDLNDGYFTNDKMEFYGNASFIKAGLTYADAISTVSETYSREIQTPEFSYGLDGLLRSRSHQLSGIINGIDYVNNNPKTDRRIYNNFSADNIEEKVKNKTKLQSRLGLPVREDVPMFGIISRLVDQKGFDLIAGVLGELMHRDVQVVVLGTGDGRYEHLFKHVAWHNSSKMSANILFDERLAQKVYAASDFFLMPSLFEPCGLGQLFAMRYGTVPIVRKTGGLADTVLHYNYDTKLGNGFVFEDYLTSGLMWAVNEALSAYYNKPVMKQIIQNAMNSDFSWSKSADKYIELYESLKNS